MDQIIVAGLMLAFVACVVLAGAAALLWLSHVQKTERMEQADRQQRAGIKWEWEERLKFETTLRELDMPMQKQRLSPGEN